MYSQFKIQYPDKLPDALQLTHTQFIQETKMALAVKLFEMDKLSSGMAAKLARVDRFYFLLNLSLWSKYD